MFRQPTVWGEGLVLGEHGRAKTNATGAKRWAFNEAPKVVLHYWCRLHQHPWTAQRHPRIGILEWQCLCVMCHDSRSCTFNFISNILFRIIFVKTNTSEFVTSLFDGFLFLRWRARAFVAGVVPAAVDTDRRRHIRAAIDCTNKTKTQKTYAGIERALFSCCGNFRLRCHHGYHINKIHIIAIVHLSRCVDLVDGWCVAEGDPNEAHSHNTQHTLFRYDIYTSIKLEMKRMNEKHTQKWMNRIDRKKNPVKSNKIQSGNRKCDIIIYIFRNRTGRVADRRRRVWLHRVPNTTVCYFRMNMDEECARRTQRTLLKLCCRSCETFNRFLRLHTQTYFTYMVSVDMNIWCACQACHRQNLNWRQICRCDKIITAFCSHYFCLFC